ncbi:MAG: carbonic anhydrase, partial [Planctomycetota bacterium]
MTLAKRSVQVWLLLAAAVAAPGQRTPDAALNALQEGNRRFAADKSVAQPVGEGVRRTLARGQSPLAIVLCCADSRVPPEHVFNAGLGELFVVRVAGHTCDAETLASIEYAVDHLNVSLCVVLGHESCGAVAATINQVDGQRSDGQSPAILQLLEQIEPAVRKAKARDLGGKELSDACEEEHVHSTIRECMRRSELLRRFASVGKFRMVPARYHLQSGEVEWLPARPLPAEPTIERVSSHTVPMGVPPHVALRMLQAGHRRYLDSGLPTADLSAERREQLTHGQQPLAIVVTCAD